MNAENVQENVGDAVSRYPCPCGSTKDFDHCHKQTGETLFAAIHDIGHTVVLPANAGQHVSFWSPCPHCRDEGEAKAGSVAHTSYSDDVAFTTYELFLYALAGGASEIACGVVPTMEKFEFGDFPASMGHDFDDLRLDLEDRGISWEAAKTNIAPCFLIVVEHLKKHAPEIRKLALQLMDKRSLTHEEVNFGFVDREQLLKDLEE